MPAVAESIKKSWWEYIVRHTEKLPSGITTEKLNTVKPELFSDRGFWFQVLHRFGAHEVTPDQYFARLKNVDRQIYGQQIRGNFWLMIQERLQKQPLDTLGDGKVKIEELKNIEDAELFDQKRYNFFALVKKLRENLFPEEYILKYKWLLEFIAAAARDISEVKMWNCQTGLVIPFRIIVGQFDFLILKDTFELDVTFHEPKPEKLAEIKTITGSAARQKLKL